MARDNDVVLPYLTSHGSGDARLAADFWLVQPNPLHVRQWRKALNESGIRWGLVIVSACFSGAFVDALRHERTMVLTAAREDQTSLGCGNDRALTYFTEHFVCDGIAVGKNLSEVFDEAIGTLARHESNAGHAPISLQRFIGEMFRDKRIETEALQACPP